MRDVSTGPTGMSGVVLAGGKSTRFGSDKASALLRGRPMLDWVVAAVGEVCDEVVVVHAPGQRLPTIAASVRLAVDDVPGEGPLAGLIAGFRTATAPVCFLTSCDVPLVRPALIAAVGGALARSDATAVAPMTEGRLQPLLGAYLRLKTLEAAEALFAVGERSLQAVLRRVGARALPDAVVVEADRDLLSFRNANDQATLEAIVRELEGDD
ncbi:MAG: molybdenum cofactor guanylyltransferase [Dehalococcoidia bacterium]